MRRQITVENTLSGTAFSRSPRRFPHPPSPRNFDPGEHPPGGPIVFRNAVFLVGALAVLLAASGCSTLSRPLPPANLQEPGWTVRQGQAIWKLPKSGRDIAGEVVVATGPDGKSFVQFSKSPFPLVIGQTTAKQWQVEFPPQAKRYSGPGAPPKRLLWLYLPRVLSGKPPPAHWTWKESDGNWRLANPATGESVEGFFQQ